MFTFDTFLGDWFYNENDNYQENVGLCQIAFLCFLEKVYFPVSLAVFWWHIWNFALNIKPDVDCTSVFENEHGSLMYSISVRSNVRHEVT